jgi:hypothetical protein
MSDNMSKVFVAPDSVVGGMVEELLKDAGYKIFMKSDDFLGIGGHARFPEIYCETEKHDEIIKFLEEKGFIKE